MNSIAIHADSRPAGHRRPVATRANDRLRNVVLGALAVMLVATFNLFHRLGEPAQPIWDESYYLTDTARYELGYAGFASHPPLGLMLIAAGDHISGRNRHVHWEAIATEKKIAGERMPVGFSYTGVRCASALFGVIAVGLLFLLMTTITGSATTGTVATSPFLFDTALITQFRAAQLDSFQLCFAIAALLALVIGDRRAHWRWLFGFGVACGLAMMVRVNGVILLVGSILPIVRAIVAEAPWRDRVMMAFKRAAFIGCGTLFAAATVFAVYLLVTPRAMPADWAAARADAPYIDDAYRSHLDGREPLSPAVAMSAAIGYRRFMAADMAGLGLTDANGSSPWSWPLGEKPIVYRWDSNGRTTAWVALVPNLAAWAVSLIGVVGGAAVLLRQRVSADAERHDEIAKLLLTLLALWTALFASDIVLAGYRVMYLYHYFMPLTVGWIITVLLLRQVRVGPFWPGAAVATVLANFLLLAPFALHQPISDRECSIRAWFSGGNVCDHSGRPSVGPGTNR